MRKIFNRKSEQKKRRYLRRNMTRAEVLLWMHLKNRQMPGYRFFRQYRVNPYVLHSECAKLKLTIEVDG